MGLVRADLAQRAIAALQWRCRAKGTVLTSSDVVVSQELRATVLEQVQRGAPRINRVAWSELLELGPDIRTRRTFIELSAGSSSSSTVTRSLTDVHLGGHS